MTIKTRTKPGIPNGRRATTAPVKSSSAPIGSLPTEPSLRAAATTDASLSVAAAVQAGMDETVVLIDAAGRARVLNDGAPLLADVAASVLHAPATLVGEADYLRLLAAYGRLQREPRGETELHCTLRIPDRPPLPVVVRASNRLHEPIASVVVHIRRARERTSDNPVPPALDGTDRELFLRQLEETVRRKCDKVWSAPSHARGIMRDRRWDYALVLIYLDRFNILLGSVGEDALETVASEACRRLQTVTRSGDLVARIDKTEVAVLLRGVSDVSHIDRLTEFMLATLSPIFKVDGAPISLVPIAGVASSRREYSSADELFRDAAAAAGRALQRGQRGHQNYETDFRVEPLHRMNMMADLKASIEQDHLFLLYQPLISLETGHFTALEAFVRWRHPERGLVMPGDFIPLAEETGLIRPLTKWVLRAGCSFLSRTPATIPLRLHINVGAAELSEKRFYADVMNILDETQVGPSQICLDMSESALVDGTESAHETMHRLGSKGVRFALDDYGTGSSSLNYLADLPFDYVKIDTSLSQHVDDTKRRIVRAMIGLAHELNREVIAEGVESSVQKNILAGLGADEAQGYLFSKPLEEAAITRALERPLAPSSKPSTDRRARRLSPTVPCIPTK
ncbi:MAG: GGDEF domain-containing phosphodiesterase [Myxococcota bacterium]